jgi:hypothetical protein
MIGRKFGSGVRHTNVRAFRKTGVTADYTDMIYAATPEEIAARRKAFIRKDSGRLVTPVRILCAISASGGFCLIC